MAQCAICENEFEEGEVVRIGEHCVCTGCKPAFVERLREGLPIVSPVRVYGGFWRRVGAQLLDGIVLLAIGYLIDLAGMLVQGVTGTVMANVLSLIVDAGYVTYFVGRHGATPGKMAWGLKVIRADGGTVSYGRAFGRFWAQLLSGLLLGIGFIMVAFDDEKRALHDHICDTRVIRTGD